MCLPKSFQNYYLVCRVQIRAKSILLVQLLFGWGGILGLSLAQHLFTWCSWINSVSNYVLNAIEPHYSYYSYWDHLSQTLSDWFSLVRIWVRVQCSHFPKWTVQKKKMYPGLIQTDQPLYMWKDCLSDIFSWMKTHHLNLNHDKEIWFPLISNLSITTSCPSGTQNVRISMWFLESTSPTRSGRFLFTTDCWVCTNSHTSSGYFHTLQLSICWSISYNISLLWSMKNSASPVNHTVSHISLI